MHTPEIASAFQPQELQSIAISCNSFSLKDVCWKKGKNETNIRKEPATCRNFQQVHWLCVWQLALFLMAFYSRLFLYVDYCCVFTLRAKNRQVSRHRVRANFCPGFVVADRAVHPTVFYHSITLLYASILPYPPGLPLPTFSAKAAGFPAAMLTFFQWQFFRFQAIHLPPCLRMSLQ